MSKYFCIITVIFAEITVKKSFNNLPKFILEITPAGEAFRLGKQLDVKLNRNKNELASDYAESELDSKAVVLSSFAHKF